jgi:hypothetical protein
MCYSGIRVEIEGTVLRDRSRNPAKRWVLSLKAIAYCQDPQLSTDSEAVAAGEFLLFADN